MAAQKFMVVSDTEAPEPPYPAQTRARGWRFELDMERVRQSDTWALAPREMRPWLLMLWVTAWDQMPCGSLPANDELIAARLGMELRLFQAHRDILLRGWVIHRDGRLYHPVITERVIALLHVRNGDKRRMAQWRSLKNQQPSEIVTRDSRVSTPNSRVSTPPEPEPEPEPVKREQGIQEEKRYQGGAGGASPAVTRDTAPAQTAEDPPAPAAPAPKGAPRAPERHRSLDLGSQATQVSPDPEKRHHGPENGLAGHGPATPPRAPDPIALLVRLGVDPAVARDWIAIRRAKRLPLTPTAAAGLEREAQAAGMSVPDAVRMAVERGWAGFRASWVQRDLAEARASPTAAVGAGLSKAGQQTAASAAEFIRKMAQRKDVIDAH